MKVEITMDKLQATFACPRCLEQTTFDASKGAQQVKCSHSCGFTFEYEAAKEKPSASTGDASAKERKSTER